MVDKITYIKERIRQVAENKGIKYKEMYDILQMTDGGFKGEHIKKPIKSDALVYLVTKFPDVDLYWLITGEQKKEDAHALNEPSLGYSLQHEIDHLKALLKAKEETIDALKQQRGFNGGSSKAG